ncbi:protein-disulfide reductase DsbD [Massilia sp. PAMC28688]|uniref:protein-disulfide reductase DsbD n=1 Tax=Massilia sp. PAMC28688 TaxID=2861283 RepID=UPI001C62BA99|nr:protein-disulfide reductase DsbD [Massilia sp. PAMC28688]QYF94795.1 protein-disulfide reductase DsbD [Massilia sp. PAMC28688]
MFSKTLRAACALLLLAFSFLFAAPPAAAEDYLEPDVAFKFSARMMDPQTVAISYDIADGYYMYRERFKFRAEGAILGEPKIPAGKVKYDETFQKDVETHRGRVTITIPVQASGMFTLVATSQGCADAGLCYAPQDASARLVGAAGTGAMSTPGSAVLASDSAVPTSDLSGIAAILGGGKLLVIVPAFILLGLGLSFTPCVLPMVPILASIIVGEGAQAKRGRGFVLAVSYSLGMAVVYTALGIAAGLIGEGLSATLQNPWVLGVVALLIVAMALSMFNVYQLQLPASLQSRLVEFSTRQRAGKLLGVFIMGAVSALIVGPCVAAPLAGALVYISQTRDVVLGGSALFAMAVGMSIPLLLVGLSAGALLPRAGAWMDSVKRFFGVLMLAMAVWLVSPVIPKALTMAAWGLLGVGYAVYLVMRSRHAVSLAVAALFVTLGGLQLAGLVTGGRDPLSPLAHFGEQEHGLPFTRIKTVAQLDAALADTGGKTVMLDFYADWCVSCIEMEKLTFVDPGVKALLANTTLLQVDVTANDADDKAMLKRFKLFGPPGIILFDANGKEIADSRVIGFQNAEKFRASLQKLR